MSAAAVCGTDPGYRRHRARGEHACRDCCRAHHNTVAGSRRPDHPLQYSAARDGHEPAEALTPNDRDRLFLRLHALGWSDTDIAQHTKTTSYTTARLRAGLGLLPNRPGASTKGAA